MYRYYDFCLVLKSGVEVPVFNENSTCIFFQSKKRIIFQIWFPFSLSIWKKKFLKAKFSYNFIQKIISYYKLEWTWEFTKDKSQLRERNMYIRIVNKQESKNKILKKYQIISYQFYTVNHMMWMKVVLKCMRMWLFLNFLRAYFYF